MSETFDKMSNEVNKEYQTWLLVNRNDNDKEKIEKFNKCLNWAYQKLSVADKTLVDSYYLNIDKMQ